MSFLFKKSKIMAAAALSLFAMASAFAGVAITVQPLPGPYARTISSISIYAAPSNGQKLISQCQKYTGNAVTFKNLSLGKGRIFYASGYSNANCGNWPVRQTKMTYKPGVGANLVILR